MSMERETPDRPEALLRDVAALEGAACLGCRRPLCGHEAIFSIAMGFKTAPRCAPCLAGALGRDTSEFKELLLEYVENRDCFRSAWKETSKKEGQAGSRRPTCLWEASPAPPPEPLPAPAPAPIGQHTPDWEWDAGDMGCGDLVLELRLRLQEMRPGQVIRVTARDPGAPEDMPAWCRLTGHRMVSARHPVYMIERKKED